MERHSVDMPMVILVAILCGMYAFLSIRRYTAYNAGMYDLGNMAQSIWSATKGHPLTFTCRGAQHTRLAFHVEFFYFLIAPVYALFDSPVTLLILQSVFLALGSLPIYRLTKRNLGSPWIARLIVICYLFYPVAQTAVLFDFHGDTLAAPLLLFTIDAWDRRAFGLYALWIGLALSCKFYVAASVAALGLVLIFRGDKRTGIWTLFAGIGWGSLAFLVIKPWAATYLTSASAFGASSPDYFSLYFGYIRQIIHPYHFVPRLATLLLIIVPALWIGHRSPLWWLPAAATVLPALASSRGSYDYRFHHYALSVPFFIVATIYGAKKIGQDKALREIIMQAAITLLLSSLLVDTPLNLTFWASVPGWGWDSWAYGRIPRDKFKDQWLIDHVPERAPLSASFFIAPHVINRSRIVALTHPKTKEATETLRQQIESTDWIIADALFDYVIPNEESNVAQKGIPIIQRSIIGIGHPSPAEGGVLYDKAAIRILLEHNHYNLSSFQDGLLLFSKKGLTEGTPLFVKLTTSEVGNEKDPIIIFGNRIGLLDFSLEPTDVNRYLLTYDWIALEAMKGAPQYLAVTQLQGAPHTRFVHLPTLALYPNNTWRSGEVVREQFEIRIPEGLEPGHYPLQVSWHDSSNMYAAWTDARSQIGKTGQVADIIVKH